MRLKELRLKAGATQKEIASHLGVTGQTLLNWENGIYEPKISELIKLANYFNVTVDYLIEKPCADDEIETLCNKLESIDKNRLISFIKSELKNNKNG